MNSLELVVRVRYIVVIGMKKWKGICFVLVVFFVICIMLVRLMIDIRVVVLSRIC